MGQRVRAGACQGRLDRACARGHKRGMSDRSDITDHLAERLRAARKARGLSLDAAARLSGVSRSMVSQIERGESSPTVATLWNLTRALGIDFAGLLAPDAAPGIDVVRASQAPVIAAAPGVHIRILSPPDAVGAHEVYDLALDAGGLLDSRPHAPGCREHLTVIAGQVAVTSGEASQVLGPGDTARYPADRAHRIAAQGGAARAILIVTDSG
jgi:XRE family transcriptional regulator, regulator of sulfur utilization